MEEIRKHLLLQQYGENKLIFLPSQIHQKSKIENSFHNK